MHGRVNSPTPFQAPSSHDLGSAFPRRRCPDRRLLRVDEVAEAEFYAGDIFRRQFGGDPPDLPETSGRVVSRFAQHLSSSSATCTAPSSMTFACSADWSRTSARSTGCRQRIRRALRSTGGVPAASSASRSPVFSAMPAFWARRGRPAHACDLSRRDFEPVADPTSWFAGIQRRRRASKSFVSDVAFGAF